MLGTTLSHYKILEELGRGGMGIVYKAEDTKLDRTVAIKVLPSAALSSKDDRARFYREAKAAAQLHHPHIASVFEIDEAVPEGSNTDDVRPFIAMEFINGETLDERIQAGPLKLNEAVRIGSEIADALKTAHEKNIVHRDIKSANVMLDANGRAKVLDFGLAKTAQSTKLTRLGSTLGTMAYMSPEQARGEEVDLRTDVWALGAVLYEMIAGRHPFPGDYEQAVVYSILNEDPEALTAVRTGVPMSLERLVDKCLAKTADRRYQSLTDVLVDLRALADELKQTTLTASRTSSRTIEPFVAQSRSDSGFNRGVLIGTAAGIVLAAIVLWIWNPFTRSSGSQTERSVLRLSLSLPDNLPMAFVGAATNSVGDTALDLSPDGSRLVYAAQTETSSALVLHDMGSTEFEVLPGTEGAFSPVFSENGDWIAFAAESEIKKVRTDGGSPVTLAFMTDGSGFEWSSDGWIYFGDRQGRFFRRVHQDGGAVETISSDQCCRPFGVIPGTPFMMIQDPVTQSLQVFDIENQTRKTLSVYGATVLFPFPNMMTFAQRGRLFAARFEPSSSEILGGAVPVVEDLRTEAVFMNGQYALSQQGALVYASGTASDMARLIWLDDKGEETIVDQPEASYGALRISPDGNRLAAVVTTATSQDIHIIDLRTGIRKPLVQGGVNWNPVWSADASTVFYSTVESGKHNVFAKNPDSAAGPDTVYAGEVSYSPAEMAPDGARLVVSSEQSGNSRLGMISTAGDGSVSVLTSAGEYHWGPRISDDGKFIAYTSVTSERSEILVEPFPPTGERWVVSSEGGEEPIWRPGRNEIVYRNNEQWMVASYVTEPTFSAAAPHVLFEGPYINVSGFEYDVAPDGRFLLLRPTSDETTTNELNVIVNWFDELKRLVPTGGQ